jgi:hypothetical protein
LASTQEIGDSVAARDGNYKPMSFSSLGRNFRSRIPFAGTYDSEWLNGRAPFFPRDFDYRYFQSAPSDQQMPHPRAGATVILENLTSEGITAFQLPAMAIPVLFIYHRGTAMQIDAAMDTVLIEPEKKRFSLTWRATLALRKNCFEIRRIVPGKTMTAYRRELISGTKPHYKNIEEFIRSKRRGR